MPVDETILETIEYRIILVLPDSGRLLALYGTRGYRLPRVSIPQRTRPAGQLQKAIKSTLGLSVFVVDFCLPQDGLPCYVIVEALRPQKIFELIPVPLGAIASSELSERQRVQLALLLSITLQPSVCQIGWVDQALSWLESETAKTLSSRSQVEQFNAGGGFSLIRFSMDDGTDYWLKATGEPNLHELTITKLLSELSRDHLPSLISVRPEWNAWLMLGESTSMAAMAEEPHEVGGFLERAAVAMAELQMKTEGHASDLLGAGAFDQSLETFEVHSEDLFEFLEEAMTLQSSTKVLRLERSRLQELRTLFTEICRRMHDLHLPTTIVHGDINCGNILMSREHCHFIDWCEAYLGNPLLSLQHLLLLNKTENLELHDLINQGIKSRYRATWLESCNAEALDEGFIYMPLLAVGSTLYGRGDWLTSARRNDPHRQSYARSLARHMDRSARDPRLQEALCR
jgi:Phosphotransferase enzyme family